MIRFVHGIRPLLRGRSHGEEGLYRRRLSHSMKQKTCGGKNVQHDKTEEGDGYPRANSGEAAGLGASTRASEATESQTHRNPAPRAPENAGPDPVAEPPASSNAGAWPPAETQPARA